MPALIIRAPLALARSAAVISAPDRGEDDRPVELLRRRFIGGTGPLGPQLAGERLRLLVAPAGEGEDTAAFVDRHLAEDVGGGAEPVEPDTLRLADQPQRPVADQPGAEQRRRLQVRVAVGDREAEALVGDRDLGVAAVDVVAGELRVVAEVLAAAAAVAALAVGPAEPRHPDPLARGELLRPLPRLAHHADDLVAHHQRQLRLGEVAVEDVEVGAADAAGADLELDLAGTGGGVGQLSQPERLPLPLEDHRPHRSR